MGTSLSTAFPRRVFTSLFAFNWIFLTSFPGFSSVNRSFIWTAWVVFISKAYPRRNFYGLSGFLFYTLVYLCHISPGHIRGGLQPPDFPLFSTIFIIRSMSAEGISIKHMVKITQSCSIFNSPRYNPLIPKAYYNNPVFFLSEAYPRRICLPQLFFMHN